MLNRRTTPLLVPPSPNSFLSISSTDSSDSSSCGGPSPATRIRKMVPISKPVRVGPRLSGEGFQYACDLFDGLCCFRSSDTDAVCVQRMVMFFEFQLHQWQQRTGQEDFDLDFAFDATRFLRGAIHSLRQLDRTITFMQLNMVLTNVLVEQCSYAQSTDCGERVLKQLVDSLPEFVALHRKELQSSDDSLPPPPPPPTPRGTDQEDGVQPPPPQSPPPSPPPRLLLRASVIDELFESFDMHNTGSVGARTVSRFVTSVLAHGQSHEAQTFLVRLRYQLEPFVVDVEDHHFKREDFSDCVMSAAMSTVASLSAEDASCWWDAEQLINSLTKEVAHRNLRTTLTPNKPALKLQPSPSSHHRLASPKFAQQHVVVPAPSFRTSSSM